MIEGKKLGEAGRVLRYGMIGGGPGSFIGGVHRGAIKLEGAAELVAGCFSRKLEDNLAVGQDLGIPKERVYANYETMAQEEAKREDGIDFVVIAAQNMVHFAASKAFLENGINVMCEKPLTTNLSDALELKRIADANGCLFGVSYSYAFHVMVLEARERILRGEIGDVINVMGEYPQEWLIDLMEQSEQRQAAWRTDPQQAGLSNCVGDIGTHIEHMVSFMTGLKIRRLCAKLDVLGEGRKLDTNAHILLEYDNGASGHYWCSQVAVGYDNGLKVRIFGTKGAIEFVQEQSNYLRVTQKGCPPQTFSRGNGYITSQAAAFSRVPSGHPEGYHEAFANLYRAYCDAVRKKLDGIEINESEVFYPTLEAGIDGVRFITKCVESSGQGAVWVDM